jgi:hypothetical protein
MRMVKTPTALMSTSGDDDDDDDDDDDIEAATASAVVPVMTPDTKLPTDSGGDDDDEEDDEEDDEDDNDDEDGFPASPSLPSFRFPALRLGCGHTDVRTYIHAIMYIYCVTFLPKEWYVHLMKYA